MTMAHHKADYLVAGNDEDLDPTGQQVTEVISAPNVAQKFETNPSVGFNTGTFNLTQNVPIRLLGADPARLQILLNTNANVDVFIGDQGTVSALQGFNLTNHNAGGAIELHTTEELWCVTTNASGAIVYMFVERSTSF